ncbi:Probable RNA-directed DNA polymerase from transposon X-element [Eumeta japonica]|uniref:Probable RNA-directed DNA polymerase from transposon X-element n=1 Tax=Eumeta variegata TaxID=151549 RepID=A0A4C1UG54_EUMVA|nr:Probable RNA-directed DNA polymerase from transposon X-element [Eumeta japonica]
MKLRGLKAYRIAVSSFAKFKHGCVNRNDKFHDGRPSTAVNNENVDPVRRMIKRDRHVTYHEIWTSLGIGALAKALKTEGAVPTPALKKPDKSIAFDDREKAECLADSIEQQCIENPPIRFRTSWKEAVVKGIPKPGKPRDLPASYRPISLLSVLGKLFEKMLKTRLSDHLIGKGLIINEQFGFRPNHFCPQQALRLIEYISDGFEVKRNTVAVFFDVAKAFDRSVMTYASPVFAHARPDLLYDLQIVQNNFCRRAADAQRYVKNSVLHWDLELPPISKFMKDASERFFDIANNHSNPLLVGRILRATSSATFL